LLDLQVNFEVYMDELHFNRKDGIFVAICLIVLAAGIVIGLKYFQKAFPEATIDFRYGRSQTEQIALACLDSLHLMPPRDFRTAGAFGYDDNAKTYLEKELGVEGARTYLGHPIRLWYWQHRWFRPATKEEYRVFVTPGGAVVRLAHEIDEQAEGADLPQAEARAIAERFLFGPMKLDSTKLSFLEAQRTGRPHRADWAFTYKAIGIEPVKGSDYRYTVGILGDKIGSYREYLHVPQAWEASFEKLRSYNEMAGQLDGIGLVLTAIAIVVVLFLKMRKRDIRWRTAIGFGIVCSVLVLLNRFNNLPLTMYGYDTTTSWSGFWTTYLWTSILTSVSMGLGILVLTASAEAMYRERYPQKPALPRMFSAQGLRTKSAFKQILLGVTLTSFFFSYQIAFYLIAGHFGAWSPSDVPYDNLLNTAMPWLAVLFMGFFPAVSEEFMSRMFSIPFLQRAFKSKLTWLAVLIPALIWGFGHSTYPNEPFFIRGLEVGMAGIVIGIVMLRWGILATLVWHYTVDALYTAMLLFRSHNAYFVFTAAVAVGLLTVPLLVALIAYLRKGSFAPETGVRNSDLGTVAEESAEPVITEAPVETVTYRPLPSGRRILAVVLLIAGIGFALIPAADVGDFLAYPVSKQEAIKRIADSLRATGWTNPDTLQMAGFATLGNEGGSADPLAYLLQHSKSVADFNKLADQTLDAGRWRVMAWKPENRLEFIGSVNSKNGKIEALIPLLPEEMPGDSLSMDSARQMVDSVLTRQGTDLSTMTVQNQSTQARPHRLDYDFTYEAKEGDPRNIAEAKYRRGGSINGSWLAVSRLPWYHVPETWQREREANTVLRTAKQAIVFLLTGGVVLWAIGLLAYRTRKGLVPWKKVLLFAIIPAAVALLAGLNEFYLSKAQYFSMIATPWAVFRTGIITQWLISSVVIYILFAVGLAALSSFFPESLPLLRRHERRAAWLDALLAGAGAIGAVLIYRSVAVWLAGVNPAWIPFSGWDIPEALSAPMPWLLMLTKGLNRLLLAITLLAFFMYLWQGPMRKPLLRVLLLIGAVIMLLPSGVPEPIQWLYSVLVNIVRVGLAYVILRFLVANRPVVLISLVAAMTIFSIAAENIGTGNGFMVLNSWIYIAIAVIVLLYWLLGGRKTTLKTES
jgi:membrane protease YdiL (CAAX protease family)